MGQNKLCDFVHNKLLELLDFADSVCEKEKFQYSLIGGTLLGAIRHNGFIPWDDDADIVMTRENLEKFKSVFNNYAQGTSYIMTNNGRVDCLTFAENPKFENTIVSHVCLDIFVIDNVPDDERAFNKQIFRLKILQGMMKKGPILWKHYSLKGRILIFGTKMLGLLYTQDRLLKKYTDISARYNDCDMRRKFISNDVYATFHIPYDKILFSETVKHQFESKQFSIFKYYHDILSTVFGDYMTPPPLAEQHFSHVVFSHIN